MGITWVLEREIFADRHERLYRAVITAGHRVISWRNDWLETGNYPELDDDHVIFHGSLGVASVLAEKMPWRPGSLCNTAAFACSSWFDQARQWLVHDEWVFCNLSTFINSPERYLEKIGAEDSFFIRPDSPLKPFSGRVLRRDQLSLDALDYGFYFNDRNLPIVITPVVPIEDEWRLIIAQQRPIAASLYLAEFRTEGREGCPEAVWRFSERVAQCISPPDPLYALDVCRCGDELKLLEINPFSGADLYACNRKEIVAAVEREYK